MLLLTSRFAVAEPTLDEEIGRAALANKPLIVELYAEWCGPCHVFEEKVLTRQDVKRALAAVEFVRYDIDRPIGGYVADRFDTRGVPAFLVFDGAGKEVDRHLGYYPAKQFLDLIARVTGARTLTSRLEAAVIERPTDMTARMALATHYLEIGRTQPARVQLGLVIDGPDRQLAALAFATRAQLDLVDQRVSAALDSALELATQFPDTPAAMMPIAILGVTGHVDRARMHDLVEKHLAVIPDESFDSAARVAIVTGDIPVARERLAVRRLKNSAVIEAELALSQEREVAEEKIAVACREPGNDYACFLLEDAVAKRVPVTTATLRMAAEARYAIESLKNTHVKAPSFHGMEVLAAQPIGFRNGVAAALRGVKQRCTHAADTNEWVFVGLKFGAGKLVSFDVQGQGELQTCIRTELPALLPTSAPADLERSLSVPLRFEMPAREQPRPLSAIGERGLFAGLAADLGNEVFTFTAHGQRAFGSRRELRYLVAADAEIGASSYGFAYAARASVGYVVPMRRLRFSLSFLAGLGISDFGDELLPRAFTLPLEARLRIAVEHQQIHLWLRDSYVLGDSIRQRASETWGMDDERAFGLGTTLSNGAGQPLYVQLSFENRVDSNAAVVTLGVAFGSF